MLNQIMKNKFPHINKLKIFQSSLILIFIIFVIFLFSPKNYTKKYTISNVAIKESYNKKEKYYYFTLNYNNISLDLLFESRYKQNRKFIEEIKIIKDDNNFCLIPEGKTFAFYPICYVDGKSTSYNAASSTLKNQLDSKYFPKKKVLDTYEDIQIYNNNYSYYIWNYDGFYYLNSKENKKIDIFSKEQYTINLIGYTKDYLVIADYDSNYTFNNFYTLDLSSSHLKKYKLNRDIYFDSYFPGYLKNKLYIVDNKESVMYEFNAKNGKLEKVPTRIYENTKWKDISIKTLSANKTMFTYKTNYNYTLKNKDLYLKYSTNENETLIATNITNIIKINHEDIFYLKGDELYHYSPSKGETLLLSYFEWNFNYNNIIFIN